MLQLTSCSGRGYTRSCVFPMGPPPHGQRVEQNQQVRLCCILILVYDKGKRGGYGRHVPYSAWSGYRGAEPPEGRIFWHASCGCTADSGVRQIANRGVRKHTVGPYTTDVQKQNRLACRDPKVEGPFFACCTKGGSYKICGVRPPLRWRVYDLDRCPGRTRKRNVNVR